VARGDDARRRALEEMSLEERRTEEENSGTPQRSTKRDDIITE
jgi:hypothetical protein